MKLVIISDTHGKRARIDEVLSRNPLYDALLFLGDGARDFDIDRTGGFIGVCGNCDSFSGLGDILPTERMLCFDGIKILMTHGHKCSVKFGTEKLEEYAATRGADAVLFGHTHVPIEKYIPAESKLGTAVTEKPMYVFNPGSLGAPNNGLPSFGVMEIRGGQILLSHGYLNE